MSSVSAVHTGVQLEIRFLTLSPKYFLCNLWIHFTDLRKEIRTVIQTAKRGLVQNREYLQPFPVQSVYILSRRVSSSQSHPFQSCFHSVDFISCASYFITSLLAANVFRCFVINTVSSLIGNLTSSLPLCMIGGHRLH